jgi:hypothetical protein
MSQQNFEAQFENYDATKVFNQNPYTGSNIAESFFPKSLATLGFFGKMGTEINIFVQK